MDNRQRRPSQEDIGDNSTSSSDTERVRATLRRRRKRKTFGTKKGAQFKAKKPHSDTTKRRMPPPPRREIPRPIVSVSEPQLLRSETRPTTRASSLRSRLSYLNIDPGQSSRKVKERLGADDAVALQTRQNEITTMLSDLTLDEKPGTSQDKKLRRSTRKKPEKKYF